MAQMNGAAGSGRRRLRLSQETLLALVSVLVSLCCNGMFWAAALKGRDFAEFSTWRFAVSTFAIVAAVHYFLFSLLAMRRTVKPLMGLVVLVAVGAMYYMQQYTVYLDASMLRNVLHTQTKEAIELVSPWLVLKILLTTLPAWLLLYWVEIPQLEWRRAALRRLLSWGLMIATAVAGLLGGYQELSALLRNQREVRYLVTPANLIVSTINVLATDARRANRERTVVGADARRLPVAAGAKPRLLVLVVGETVRAQNWGMNGYERQTTPEFAARTPINFSDVTSCGTATEVSLPCMFSAIGRRDYDEDRIRGEQSLLHVLDHAGVKSDWIDNQTGCKHVCDGLPIEDIRGDEDPDLCDGRVCLDEVLLDRVKSRLDGIQSDTVIVLHPLGNHGPSYSKRYPPAFRRYTPTCESADFGDCDSESIRNAYDNSLLYTDHVLARLVDMIGADARFDSGLLFLSDHGESLGEHGLFLHGVPYAIAPEQQTKVPMALWLSPGWWQRLGLDAGCIAEKASQPHAHDHLFHSVLGLFDVSTSVYDADWDMLRTCRPPPAAVSG